MGRQAHATEIRNDDSVVFDQYFGERYPHISRVAEAMQQEHRRACPPTRTYWVPPLTGICRPRKVSGQTPIVAWAVGVQAVSAAAKAVSAVARNGCREVNRPKFSIGWTLPWLPRQPRLLLADSADHAHLFQHARPGRKGVGKPMASNTLIKPSGPRASFAWPCCMKPNPTMSSGGMAYHAAGIRKGEIARKGCSNAGFIMLTPRYRRPRKIPAKVQLPRLHKIDQNGHYADKWKCD